MPLPLCPFSTCIVQEQGFSILVYIEGEVQGLTDCLNETLSVHIIHKCLSDNKDVESLNPVSRPGASCFARIATAFTSDRSDCLYCAFPKLCTAKEQSCAFPPKYSHICFSDA